MSPIKPASKSFISHLVRDPSIVEGRPCPSKHSGWTDKLHAGAEEAMKRKERIAAQAALNRAREEAAAEGEIESDFGDEED